MERNVREVMTSNPRTIESSTSTTEAARLMKDEDVGSLPIVEGDRLSGMVTDRDIAVRIVAEGRDPSTPAREACSAGDLTTVTPDTTAEQAAQIMRDNAVRRLPVVEGDRPVGVVSLGDLAIERDEHSALAEISAAEGDV